MSRRLALCVCLLHWLAVARAEPLADLAQVSGLRLDAQKLKAGEVISARGSQGSFARGVYIESCFYVKALPASVEAALLEWDPSKHPQDDVTFYGTSRAPGGIDFTRLTNLSAKRPADRWMLEQSRAAADGKRSELHLMPADEAILRAEPVAGTAWKRILERRAGAGLTMAGKFQAGDLTIEPNEEFSSLVGMTPKIAARFSGVETRGVIDYAEQGLTQGHTSFSLGILASREGTGSSQVVDCTYYPSDTYLLSADFYELWAWEGGTLVWQVDYVSAAFRAYTHGLDKVLAGREMIKETGKSIAAFRKSVEH